MAPNYDSEAEDSPRTVLDIHGDFVIYNSSPQIVLKLAELNEAKKQFGPGGGVMAVRPVPEPASVARAKLAMGDGSAGVWTGTLFHPPECLPPASVFRERPINTLNPGMTVARFCHRRRLATTFTDLKTMAIYTDGACSFNGQASPQGGFAFVYNEQSDGVFGKHLEHTGPSGEAYTPTSNRAELRAVIAALEFRSWWGEGWQRIVIITDSEYVGKGATEWLRKWASNDWRTAGGKPTANRDLWEALSKLLGLYAQAGCEISFWMVPRELNTVADAAAKDFSNSDGAEGYQRHIGILG